MSSSPGGRRTGAVTALSSARRRASGPETPDRVIVFARGCLPRLENPGDLTPTRNASGFDLSQKDPARHPRWDHIVNIVDRNGRLIESWSSTTSCLCGRTASSSVHATRSPRVAGRRRRARALQVHARRQAAGADDRRRESRATTRRTSRGRLTSAFLPDGTFFVSDGYTNTRVVKFDRNGKYVTSWGMRGGQRRRGRYMNTVHAIVADKQRRLYVSDRANHRIQIFDENGKFLEHWQNVPLPYSLMMTDDQFLWSASGRR